MYRYFIAPGAAVMLLIVAALVQGQFTERWVNRPVTAEQMAFAERLKNAPVSVGDWQSFEVPVDERQLEASRSAGSYSRTFQHRFSPKKVVHVFVVCGHPRDVTLHTPDQCYVLNGFSEVEEERKYPIDTGKSVAFFWTSRFRKGVSFEGPQHLRIFWSFSENGEWVSPTIARVELANAPAVHKIYAITEVSGDARERPDESVAVEFLREFIPALNAVLFPPEGTEGAAQSGGKPAKAQSAVPADSVVPGRQGAADKPLAPAADF